MSDDQTAAETTTETPTETVATGGEGTVAPDVVADAVAYLRDGGDAKTDAETPAETPTDGASDADKAAEGDSSGEGNGDERATLDELYARIAEQDAKLREQAADLKAGEGKSLEDIIASDPSRALDLALTALGADEGEPEETQPTVSPEIEALRQEIEALKADRARDAEQASMAAHARALEQAVKASDGDRWAIISGYGADAINAAVQVAKAAKAQTGVAISDEQALDAVEAQLEKDLREKVAALTSVGKVAKILGMAPSPAAAPKTATQATSTQDGGLVASGGAEAIAETGDPLADAVAFLSREQAKQTE